MIRKKTVLVLGAGASFPYGFPLGAALTNQLRRAAYADDIAPMFQAKTVDVRIEASELREFLKRFNQSRLLSVDSFLARHEALVPIGKKAIAISLMLKENSISLIQTAFTDDDWYEYLWNNLTSECHNPTEFGDNKLKIVTFNYDRSLEHYLHCAAMATFDIDFNAARTLLAAIPIVHVYGKLGEYSQKTSKDTREYDSELNWHTLEVAASGINIIPEERQSSAYFQKAHEYFFWADQVCFLGFGFDALNTSRLGLTQILDERTKAGKGALAFFASAFERTPMERMSDATRATGNHGGISFYEDTNRMALRKMGIFI